MELLGSTSMVVPTGDASPVLATTGAHGHLVNAVVSGQIDPTDPANFSLGLPSSAEIGSLDPFFDECLLLLRRDFPVSARLCFYMRAKISDALCPVALSDLCAAKAEESRGHLRNCWTASLLDARRPARRGGPRSGGSDGWHPQLDARRRVMVTHLFQEGASSQSPRIPNADRTRRRARRVTWRHCPPPCRLVPAVEWGVLASAELFTSSATAPHLGRSCRLTCSCEWAGRVGSTSSARASYRATSPQLAPRFFTRICTRHGSLASPPPTPSSISRDSASSCAPPAQRITHACGQRARRRRRGDRDRAIALAPPPAWTLTPAATVLLLLLRHRSTCGCSSCPSSRLGKRSFSAMATSTHDDV